MENIKNFGPNLRLAIDGSRYKTYQKAADAFEISLSYLQQLMRSEREPSLELLLLIVEKLETSASLLLGDNKPQNLDFKDRNTLILDIQSRLTTMNENELRSILKLASTFSRGKSSESNEVG